MRKLLLVTAITLLTGMVASCDKESEEIANETWVPIAEKDLRHTVHVGDVVTIKSNEMSTFLLSPTSVFYDSEIKGPSKGGYPLSARSHWLECCQTDSATFSFTVYEPEATDTTTYMYCRFQAPPGFVGYSIVSFHLVK